MASIRYRKHRKRWQVRWHVTAPNGKIDKGSFDLPQGATRLDAELVSRRHTERAKDIKLGRLAPCEQLDVATAKWLRHNARHTERTQELYRRVLGRFLNGLGPRVQTAQQVRTEHIGDYINSMLAAGLKNRPGQRKIR